MFSKNLTYYRLKQNMTKKELAERVGVTAMAITKYEKGERVPNIETIKRIAGALDAKIADFLAARNKNLEFKHGEFRKGCALAVGRQDLVHESIEEYFSRFFTIVDILGEKVLSDVPEFGNIELVEDDEENARRIRAWLNIAMDGPVPELISVLENKGILIYLLNYKNESFSGINGVVNERPYVVANKNMNPERQRSTIIHELSHLLFIWPQNMKQSDCEKRATAISGAFLFPKVDAVRELGYKRSAISNDMGIVAKEYGISMQLLAKRARLSDIIPDQVYRNFCIAAAQAGWRKNEPSRIEQEETTLFKQLIYRAIAEDAISVQRGAELLGTSYDEVSKECFIEVP